MSLRMGASATGMARENPRNHVSLVLVKKPPHIRALDIHDGMQCDMDQYEKWETTELGAVCPHCTAPDFVECVAGDYVCSPHCCTCFSAQSQTLFLNPGSLGVGDQWITLTGSFVAPSDLSLVRIHTEGAASAYVRRVSVEKCIRSGLVGGLC